MAQASQLGQRRRLLLVLLLMFISGGLILYSYQPNLSKLQWRNPISSHSEDGSFLHNILEARKRLIKEICTKYNSSISRNIMSDIYVEDNYKLLYCQVPKTGCSNWKRTMIVLAGKAHDAESIDHNVVHYGENLKQLSSFNNMEIIYRLKTYTKYMFVREPLNRMVSAYRDKFENPNQYYHSEFGRHIISKYRVHPSLEALKTGDGVTFEEFVQYLLDDKKPVGMDIHWTEAFQLCNPCLIDYDFIGTFENMQEESNFLLRLIGAPPNLTMPTFKDRNPNDARTSTDVTEEYLSQVSMGRRLRLYDFYHMDYQLFSYPVPLYLVTPDETLVLKSHSATSKSLLWFYIFIITFALIKVESLSEG